MRAHLVMICRTHFNFCKKKKRKRAVSRICLLESDFLIRSILVTVQVHHTACSHDDCVCVCVHVPHCTFDFREGCIFRKYCRKHIAAKQTQEATTDQSANHCNRLWERRWKVLKVRQTTTRVSEIFTPLTPEGEPSSDVPRRLIGVFAPRPKNMLTQLGLVCKYKPLRQNYKRSRQEDTGASPGCSPFLEWGHWNKTNRFILAHTRF